MTVFLGVDGGGTKTAFMLVTDTGETLATAHAPSAYYFGKGIATLHTVLSEGVGRVCRKAGIEPSGIGHAFFGLPGYGEASTDIEHLDALPREVLGHDRYSCGNDMVCGWAGSLGGTDGINVVSGTGSMTYGEREGRAHRVGGWGELFGDEGSAYWIAVRGLNAFSRMSDGRMPRGPLYEAIRARVDVRSDLDVINVVHNDWGGGRGAIADLSKTVVAADEDGDPVAAAILADACAELAALVDTTRLKLEFDEPLPIPVSYSGGMFNADAMRRGLDEALAVRSPRYDVREPLFSPVVGAALYAAKRSGFPFSDAALARLRSH